MYILPSTSPSCPSPYTAHQLLFPRPDSMDSPAVFIPVAVLLHDVLEITHGPTLEVRHRLAGDAGEGWHRIALRLINQDLLDRNGLRGRCTAGYTLDALPELEQLLDGCSGDVW